MGGCSSDLRKAMRNGDLHQMRQILEEAGNGAPDLINDDTTADCLLDWMDCSRKNNHPPLHTATHKQNVDMVKLLLDFGGDIAGEDLDGNTVLHLAANVNNVNLCKLFIQHGADVNLLNFDGRPAPFSAAQSYTSKAHGDISALMYFIDEKKFDINWKDIEGYTLLHIAARFGNGAAVEFLLAKGSSQDTLTTNGHTPAALAPSSIGHLFR